MAGLTDILHVAIVAVSVATLPALDLAVVSALLAYNLETRCARFGWGLLLLPYYGFAIGFVSLSAPSALAAFPSRTEGSKTSYGFRNRYQNGRAYEYGH